MNWLQDSNRIWHLARRAYYILDHTNYYDSTTTFQCLDVHDRFSARLQHEIIDSELGSDTIINRYVDENPISMCLRCWQFFETSNDPETSLIAPARINLKTREMLRQLESAHETLRAAGVPEVVPGRVVVVTEVGGSDKVAYNFTNTSADRLDLPDVVDIPSTTAFGTQVVGKFTGLTYEWQGAVYVVLDVVTPARWIAGGGMVRHKPPREFTNTEFGIPGNPTHRRR